MVLNLSLLSEISITIDRVYLKGLENGNWCWSQVGDLRLDDLESANRMYNISPLTFIEVR